MKARGIGFWQKSMLYITWLAVITNCGIFIGVSEQMRQWFPALFKTGGAYDMDGLANPIKKGKEGLVLGIVIILEHAMFVLFLAVQFFIDDMSEDLQESRSRQAYEEKIAKREEASESG